MITKIKKFFRMRKEKKIQKIAMQIEVLETLATICLYLDFDGHYSRNRYSDYMRSHFKQLKYYSSVLKEEMVGDAE